MSTRREFLGTAGTLAGVTALGSGGVAIGALTSPSATLGWMDEVSQPVYAARSELTYIPMRDGVRLAARLVMPDVETGSSLFPALLTYAPYRFSESDGLGRSAYFAERGFVIAYVDVRGTGTSEGLTPDNEYSHQEQIDCEDVIEWLANQGWSNGSVGMFGSSYGGFNAIQMAMRKPPALKAIVAMHATDDVYTDDIVYYDGALQFESLGRWPFFMIALNGMPAWPDYDASTIEAKYRVENEPWVFGMLRHQRNSEFWQRMSLRPDYDSIEIPTMMVGGWLDAYTDSIPRMLTELSVPRRAIVGQWTHGLGRPGPAFNISPEMLRWWDHWLKGNDTGVLDEPELAMYVNESYKPDLRIKEIPGSWCETEWPPEGLSKVVLYPQQNGTLNHTIEADHEAELEYVATVGLTNRYRCPHNAAELPIDQRADDAYSMSFDTTPLGGPIELLGFPEAVLHVSASAPLANWIVRLCDVAPDGTSTLVSKGIINGAHRHSHVEPEPLVPDEVYELRFNLKAMSWVFPKGHKIRIAIANADFPNLWPTPYAMSTKLFVSEARPSRLELPVMAEAEDNRAAYTPPPVSEAASESGPGPKDSWDIIKDRMQGTVTVYRETILPFGMTERRWCTASDADPAVASIRAEGNYTVQADDGTETVCYSWMDIKSSLSEFLIEARRELHVDGQKVLEKKWSDRIPRDLV